MELSITDEERKTLMLNDLTEIEKNCSTNNEENDTFFLSCEMKIKQQYYHKVKTIFYIQYHEGKFRFSIVMKLPKFGVDKLEMEDITVFLQSCSTKEEVIDFYLGMDHDNLSSYVLQGLKKELCWFLSPCLICDNSSANIACPKCNYTMCPFCVSSLIFQCRFEKKRNDDFDDDDNDDFISCPQCKMKLPF